MAFINGTSDDDRLIGTSDADTISGYGGNDTIFLSADQDTVDGGTGSYDYLAAYDRFSDNGSGSGSGPVSIILAPPGTGATGTLTHATGTTTFSGIEFVFAGPNIDVSGSPYAAPLEIALAEGSTPTLNTHGLANVYFRPNSLKLCRTEPRDRHLPRGPRGQQFPRRYPGRRALTRWRYFRRYFQG